MIIYNFDLYKVITADAHLYQLNIVTKKIFSFFFSILVLFNV